MSENEEPIADAEPALSVLNFHRDTLKKREFYGKNSVSNKERWLSESVKETTQPVTYLGPSSHPTPRSTKQPISRRETVSFPSSFTTPSSSHQFAATPSFSSRSEGKTDPLAFGENMYVECTLLKNNALLLRDALRNSNLEVAVLRALIEDVRNAKDALNKNISAQLSVILEELQERIGREQGPTNVRVSSVAHPNPFNPNLGFSSQFPFTPTAIHPYPPPFYFQHMHEPLVSESGFTPYSTQTAH